jgi:hypothetical protein
LVRTDDNREFVMVAQGVAKTTRSLILKAYCQRTQQIMCIKCSRDASDSFVKKIDVITQLNRANVPNVPGYCLAGNCIGAERNIIVLPLTW